MGASIRVHDPYVANWQEIKDEYLNNDSFGYGCFFTRQENMRNLMIEQDIWLAVAGVKAIVLAVRHKPYVNLKIHSESSKQWVNRVR